MLWAVLLTDLLIKFQHGQILALTPKLQPVIFELGRIKLRTELISMAPAIDVLKSHGNRIAF